jgi:hypothetical protein
MWLAPKNGCVAVNSRAIRRILTQSGGLYNERVLTATTNYQKAPSIPRRGFLVVCSDCLAFLTLNKRT